MLLAGNFGECRPNHFHSGIDIKTQGKENFTVYAAAEGYISRIKMDKGGFGHALYITHPNGFTTLYAHLNDFIPPVQQYMKKIQYERESWAVDISLNPDQFPVKKGQQIAWSGNTGGSQAPHLHFEIRDTKTEHPLNPLLFGFPITDTRAPLPIHLSFYNAYHSIYNQSAAIEQLKTQGKNYTTVKDTIITASDKIGIGVHVNDFMDGSDNTLNFYTASWYMDGQLQGTITLDDISYDVTRYLHAYADHKLRKEKGNWFQLLFCLPGNRLQHIYSALNTEQGLLQLKTGQAHAIAIDITDAWNNTSRISFYVKSGTGALQEDTCMRMFRVNNSNRFEHPNVKLVLTEKDIYDNICFQFSIQPDLKSFSDRYQVHYPYVPVHQYFNLHLKPNKPIPFNLRDKIVLMYSDGKNISGSAAGFENGWYANPVRNFGTYWLAADTTAPVITPLQQQHAQLAAAKQISFRVKDDITSVKTFRAELNGKWLCFEPRGDIFFYSFDEHCPRGKHNLKIIAGDENGNVRTLNYSFVR